MADVHSKAIRSYNMSQIKGKDSKPELLLRKYLFSKGLRYKLHNKKMPGTPDLIFPKYKTVIFVNGCFWHGHEGCRFFILPKTRPEWWAEKIAKNKSRDNKNRLDLENLGWKVVVVWECELKQLHREETLKKVLTNFSKD